MACIDRQKIPHDLLLGTIALTDHVIDTGNYDKLLDSGLEKLISFSLLQPTSGEDETKYYEIHSLVPLSMTNFIDITPAQKATSIEKIAKAFADYLSCESFQAPLSETYASHTISLMAKTTDDSLDTATICLSLSVYYQHKGRYSDAEIMAERSLNCWKKCPLRG